MHYRYITKIENKSPQHAYRVQLKNTKLEFESKVQQRSLLRKKKESSVDILELSRQFNLGILAQYLDAPHNLEQYLLEKKNLEKELNLQIEANEARYKELELERARVEKEEGRLQAQNENTKDRLQDYQQEKKSLEHEYHAKADKENDAKLIAEQKYAHNRKTKSSKAIVDNFTPQRTQFINEKTELMNGKDDFVIYLGGFYIYEHLCKKTKIPFVTLAMDIETLIQYKSVQKQLTSNDRKRIEKLLQQKEVEVLAYMLKHNCKLEQEAVIL